MARHPDIPLWLCVGDVADDLGRYQPVPKPLHWIKGNNEGFDAVAEGALPENLFFLPNARATDIGGLRVAGLGGTLAPTWYETPAGALPHPKKGSARATELADKRRHFVREEVEACKVMKGIDIFMSHEAPRPFLVGQGSGREARGRGIDAGKTPVNEVLAAMQPKLHLFGHHHRFSEQDRQGVRSVGLDLVSRSYLLIDPKTMKYEVVQV
jgi:Icc-related predicted phosphoesterase